MDATGVRFHEIASAIAMLLGLAATITTLVVVATVVRRHRPDAYQPLLWWAIGGVAMSLANAVVFPLITAVFRDEAMSAIAVWFIVGGLLHFGLVLVLVRGLVAIAQPPKRLVVESDAPYR